MREYKILCDSASDLTMQEYETLGVEVVPFYITFDGEKYFRDLFELSTEEFYTTIVEKKAQPKTSLPNVQDFLDVFTNYINQDLDIFLITITSKFSGAYQCSVTARDLLLEKYPDRKIVICDSMLCTAAQGLLVRNAVGMKQSGATITELAECMEQIKKSGLITFSVDSLEHLQRGGRIGKVAGFVGGLFNIKPIIQMTDGELKPYSKVRGRKKALSSVLQIHISTIKRHEDHDIQIIHSTSYDEAVEFEKELLKDYGIKSVHPIRHIGSTIGVHIGPGVVGLASIRRFDK